MDVAGWPASAAEPNDHGVQWRKNWTARLINKDPLSHLPPAKSGIERNEIVATKEKTEVYLKNIPHKLLRPTHGPGRKATALEIRTGDDAANTSHRNAPARYRYFVPQYADMGGGLITAPKNAVPTCSPPRQAVPGAPENVRCPVEQSLRLSFPKSPG